MVEKAYVCPNGLFSNEAHTLARATWRLTAEPVSHLAPQL